MAMSKPHLPIDDFLEVIYQNLQNHQNVVITAAPGAGKTTRLPAFLAQRLSGKILVLEPRRMAALAAASRIAEEAQWTLGEEVGYQVRFANKSKSGTKLLFMTEALLAKKLLADQHLQGIDVIILDEFHERSIHVDLALGMIRELQELGHPLKLIVMSATLEASKIASYLGNAPTIAVPGKSHPLEIVYSKSPLPLQLNANFYDRLFETVKDARTHGHRHILVFLPGVGEIERAKERLKDLASTQNISLQTLHGNLSLEEQRLVLRPNHNDRIILATNIAESSVTLDGVDCVIDSGLAKIMKHDYKTGFSRLELSRISLGSATQRAGRSARQGPGRCYRLWNKMDEISMSNFETPEILRSELSESLLYLAYQGISHFHQFTWFEVPPTLALQKSTETLQYLELLDANRGITSKGKELVHWPLPVRLGAVVLEGAHRGQVALACKLAALIQEKDFLLKDRHIDVLEESQSDLVYRLHLLEEYLAGKKVYDVSAAGLSLVKQTVEQLIKQSQTKKSLETAPSSALHLESIHHLLIAGFKDRLCRRRQASGEKALLSTGRGISIHSSSLNRKGLFFLALDGAETGTASDTSIKICHTLPKDWLLKHFGNEIIHKKEIFYDEEKSNFYEKDLKVLWNLPFEESAPKLADPHYIRQHLPEVLTLRFTDFAKGNESLASFLAKISFLQGHKEEVPQQIQTLLLDLNLYDFANSELWNDFCQLITTGESSYQNIIEKNHDWALKQVLPLQVSELVFNQMPDKLPVPSGSLIKVHYPADKAPYLEVRIQEVFGLDKTPLLFKQIPITFHLLGPNYRPVQVTSDLSSFWLNGYPEVRKELRLKYPKHQWPEDPSQGVPEAKGRPRKS